MNSKVFFGLTSEEVLTSRAKNGENILKARKKKSFFIRLLMNFNDPIIRILLVAMGLNIIFSLGSMDISETIGMLLAVLISTTVSTVSEYGSERAFEKLSEESFNITCRVMRNGICESVSISEIVVGDCVIIGTGDRVPADGFLLDGEVTVDQSSINGESKEARKKLSGERELSPDKINALLRGSVVTGGNGIMLVAKVGEDTCIGRVASTLSEDTRESPLKHRLSGLAKTLSKLGFVLAFLVAAVYLYNELVIGSGFNIDVLMSKLGNKEYLIEHILNSLSLAVTILVVAVPEGLPMMICVILSANMKRMMNDKILVKKLVGIETAGSINLLFCDKTGTLTSGNQNVEKIISPVGVDISGSKYKKKAYICEILEACARYNSECTIKNGRAQGSNATDRAISDYFLSRESQKRTKPLSVRARVPFSSVYKFSAVALSNGCVIVKGAPEILLERARYIVTEDGKRAEINKDGLRVRINELAGMSMRVIAVAICDTLPKSGVLPELSLVAFIGIRDSIRRSSLGAVKKLHNAGIRVVMVTGDNRETASSVAKEIGIIKGKDDIIISGEELSKMSDEEVERILPRLSVVSRSLPNDKTRLVKIAQKIGLVVGMTGDGVNDAAALKSADVGFSMGTGTEVAKEAGDIVILNNDIASIVKAVLFGRTIFKSIRKFIVFQLTMNLCAVLVTVVAPFLGVESPITIVQMLWVNLIMDTLGGLAFAGEAAEERTLSEKPKDRSEPLLSLGMIAKVASLLISTLGICFFFLISEGVKERFHFYTDQIYYYAAFFCLFIFLSVINSFNARCDRVNIFANLYKNKSFIIIMGAVLLIQLLMVYYGGELFRAAPLLLKDLLYVGALSTLTVPLDFIRKIIIKLVKRA